MNRQLISARQIELTILMPCLNEAETIGTCIRKAQDFLRRSGISGEVLIADNGSTDGSQTIAEGLGARVQPVSRKGYGAALIGGIAAAWGKYIIMGDADDSYDFSDLYSFLGELRTGTSLVMGNRFRGGIATGAMPFLHRYLGNPGLSFLGRLFFKIPIGDFHCGLRGFQTSDVRNLHLQATGMEFATEMVLRFCFSGHKISEVPTTLSRDGRSRAPHLRTWRDGWRHLKLLLMYSPRWLFFIPGALFACAGLLGSLALFRGPVEIWNGITLDLNAFIFTCLMLIVGIQVLTFGALAVVYSARSGLVSPGKRRQVIIGYATIDRMVASACLLAILSAAFFFFALKLWSNVHFGQLSDPRVPRFMIASMTLIVLALQMFFSGFLLGIMGIPRRHDMQV